jgi:hypothetical protein
MLISGRDRKGRSKPHRREPIENEHAFRADTDFLDRVA